MGRRREQRAHNTTRETETETETDERERGRRKSMTTAPPTTGEFNAFDARSYDEKMKELMTDAAEDFAPEWTEVCESFDDMGLHENLLRGIYAYGFEKPSAIQQRGIVPMCRGLDVIQQAQSGTGKTATFCAGVLHLLDYSLPECQALVLAPTRELAQQIEKVMRALGDYLQVKCHACVGGTSVSEDTRILQSGVHVVVGTPGRVYDMLRGGPSGRTTSRSSPSMRPMRCFPGDSRTRSTTSSSFCQRSFRSESSRPPCPLRPLRSPGSSWPSQ